MTAKELLIEQFRLFHMSVKANLEGMTAERSLAQPAPAGNCANWILGHLLGVHNAALALVGKEPAWDSTALARARSRTDPIRGPEDALDWDAMAAAMTAAEGPLLSGLAELPDEALAEGGFDDPFGGTTTRGALLNLLAMHQNYHAGQLGVARRIAGLDGAIRGPES